jgi:hypothetical protein
MGRFCSRVPWLIVAVSALLAIAACGGGSKAGPPLFAGKVALTPSATTSLEAGSTLVFTTSVQTASGTNLNTTVTYTSSDTSILNISPAGVACGGHWDALFSTCTAGAPGVAQVTASALGGTSVPTFVFVHPPIDNITVNGILLTGVPVQEPCLSQSQTMTLEAHAFSQGVDITSSVGPFTWTALNPTVVTLTPLSNTAINPITGTTYNFATNQATAAAAMPGITYIYASAGGATSTTFQQPTLTNTAGDTSPLLDFFATCPIQNIGLELGEAGSGQTSLVAAKGGSAPTVVATLSDIMGASSLPNSNGGPVLAKIPLTWAASQPGALNIGTGCTQSCALAITSPGAGTVTASCSPPTCNVGFPLVPATLSTATQIATCSTYFQAIYPNFGGCQLLIPTPVYSSNELTVPASPTSQQIPLTPMAAISVQITGATSTANVFASSFGCAHVSPTDCSTSAYYLVTSKASAGAQATLLANPNSFLWDPLGAKLYMGSDFGVETVNPANFGTNTSPFSPLGSITGKVLAVSANGNSAIFSDTIHTPNQVYVVQTSPTAVTTPLNISGATAAAFSPDGLKAFIVGGTNASSLYVFSPLQALQGPFALSGPANAISFSPNGAFAFIAESANGATAANIAAYANCNNQLVGSVNLPANPILMRVLPNVILDGVDSYGYSFATNASQYPQYPLHSGIHILVLDSTGFDVATAVISPPPGPTPALCPQSITFTSNDTTPRPTQRIELGTTINTQSGSPNFFASADGTLLYVVNPGSSSIIVYNFVTGATTGGIEILNNATPLSADISADAGTIAVVGSDGLLHEISTGIGGADLFQLPFPDLPNYLNPFCTFTPTAGPCTLNIALVKP